MEQSHSWEANSYSASQEIPEGSFPCGPYPETRESSILFPF
jgi:hypothetical protein